MNTQYTDDHEDDIYSDSLTGESILIDDTDDDEEHQDYEIDLIYNDDHVHLDSEKQHLKYYIGICKYIRGTNDLLFLSCVSPKVYFKYKHINIIEYLREYSISYVAKPPLHIMQLDIDSTDTNYTVILKTHWLRLVQKHWKKTFRERKRIMEERKSLRSIVAFRIYGKYQFGARSMPGLQGMMREYQRGWIHQITYQMSSNIKTG